jgi:hypothetical protein
VNVEGSSAAFEAALRILSRHLVAVATFAIVAAPLVVLSALVDTPATQQTFRGCVVAVTDSYLVMRMSGEDAGSRGVVRFGLTGATTSDTQLAADTCVAVAAWEQGSDWYAASITAEVDVDDETLAGSR